MSDVMAVAVTHMAAVRSGDPEAMAGDYADDAVLIRGDDRYGGRDVIRAYFSTVPQRLGDGVVEFGEPEVDGDRVVLPWRINGGPADGTSGRDTFTIRGGRIVEQVVRLADADF